MKCPKCSKEIADKALFCGYCGATIEKSQNEMPPKMDDVITASPETHGNTAKAGAKRNSPKKGDPAAIATKPPGKKKRIGLVILLIFSVLAVVSGGILGFLSARGFIDWRIYIPIDKFIWTDRAAGVVADIVTDTGEETKEKDETAVSDIEASDSQDFAENQSNAPEASAEGTEPSSESDGQALEVIDEHYAKYLDTSLLLIVDDKVHIWSSDTIDNILQTVKQITSESNYSTMIVVTNDMFGLTNQEFADDYFLHAFSSNSDSSEQHKDGYLFLINLADREYYLSAFGNAADYLTDSLLKESFEIIQPYMVEDDYETAVIKLIQNIPY